MKFGIDADQGHVISGYVAPDNQLAVSRVRVSVEGRSVLEVSATGVDEGIRASGWHATGLCRFVIDEHNLPGLSEIRNLDIHDVDTNVLIHRRAVGSEFCDKKLLLINASINEDPALQDSLYPHFEMSYFNINKFPEDILAHILGNPYIKSRLFAGSLLIPRYEGEYDFGNCISALLVEDPFVEMARRMFWLRSRAALVDDEAQSWRLGDLIEAVRFAAETDYDDIKSVKHFFRMLPQEAYRLLFNPLTRVLATRLPDDRIFPANSIIAVEVLARIGIVGHRNYYEAFAATVFDRLEIVAPPPSPSPIPAEILAFAERLRGIKAAVDFLVFDEVISRSVQDAVARNWAG
ncbi:hypothetical protein MMMDOFMJ_1885 [Methylobacterium gnaphalii]|uniref:Uncharacterized protein n=1 Tax=Methylobacterium gnaphalii TaxID=1010610 RepID=A0A512JPL0_9HYPH|nr:hypothetical protein MGN01_37360 [Methylobacterium gnaphalii]GJD68959.1 hypothetical protein MMMDOFMJ_1885 [Methylobacterium gnaphalii]GLS47673.1 hypothetical protein GCM10007885_05170 [Methylobacterium gnaphalii]